jgi:hypothetical protein
VLNFIKNRIHDGGMCVKENSAILENTAGILNRVLDQSTDNGNRGNEENFSGFSSYKNIITFRLTRNNVRSVIPNKTEDLNKKLKFRNLEVCKCVYNNE